MKICDNPADQLNPTMVSDGSGGAIITWQDWRLSSFSDIYAQHVDASGIHQWPRNGVGICTASGTQNYPTIASDGSGDAIITWWDNRRTGFADIYAQRVDLSGSGLWGRNGVAICTALGGKGCPTIVSDGSGGAIIAWKDGRNADFDIYAQRVFSNGSLSIPEIFVDPDPIDFNYVVYGSSKALTVSIGNAGNAPLVVTDIVANFTAAHLGISNTSFTVQPGATYNIDLNLRPYNVGYLRETLYIISNDPNSPTRLKVLAFVGEYPLGDLNGDDKVNGHDADLILQFAAGLISRFPIASVGGRFPLGDLSGDYIVSDHDANLIFDFMQGRINEFPVASMMTPSPASSIQRHYEVSVPSLSVAEGQRIAVPIQINDATGAVAGSISLKYDTTVLKAVGVSLKLNGAYWQANTELDGEVRVAFVSAAAKTKFSHSKSQPLFVVEFDVLANSEGKISPLILDQIKLTESLSIKKVNGLITVLPGESRLHQNYPNPFNPETWIPYQIATDSPAMISIYNTGGRLIRTITLGNKNAGVYITKDKAAYWDGRDSLGQAVASGVYFYTLQAGKFTATRRMLIVK